MHNIFSHATHYNTDFLDDNVYIKFMPCGSDVIIQSVNHNFQYYAHSLMKNGINQLTETHRLMLHTLFLVQSSTLIESQYENRCN